MISLRVIAQFLGMLGLLLGLAGVLLTAVYPPERVRGVCGTFDGPVHRTYFDGLPAIAQLRSQRVETKIGLALIVLSVVLQVASMVRDL